MARALKQPERQSFDGPCRVERIGDVIVVESTQNGVTTRCEMSEFNAWRIFGCLALILEIPLPSRIGKAINLGDKAGNPPKAIIGYPEPTSLGERVAQSLVMQELERRGVVTEDEEKTK